MSHHTARSREVPYVRQLILTALKIGETYLIHVFV